jgi:hypothetical protein
VIENAGSKATRDAAAKDTSDLQRTVESLIEARPDLADPEKLHLSKEVLNKHIATRNSTQELAARQVRDRISKTEMNQARKITSFATAVSGAVSAGLIAASIAPGAPELAIVGVALIGLLGSKFAASGVDRLMDKSQ